MNILFSTGAVVGEVGGPFHSLQQLARSLSRNSDLKVQVLGTSKKGNIDVSEDWGVKTTGLKQSGPANLHLSFGVRNWLNLNGPFDIVVLNNLWLGTNGSVSRWCRDNSVPYIVSPRGCFNSSALAHSRWKKAIAKRLFVNRMLAGASAVHCLTENEAEFARAFGLKDTCTAIIPNGINVESITPSPKNDQSGICRFVYLGRFHPIKGMDLMLEAFGRIKKSGEPNSWRLDIIGSEDSDGYLSKLKNWCDGFGIGDNVEFFGPQFGANKYASLNAADVFILPSRSEGFSMAVLESLAAATPVLVTRQCNFPEVAAAKVGWEVECSVNGIASGLMEVLSTSPSQINSRSLAARRFVKNHYDWTQIASCFLELFAWMLDSRPCPEFVKR